MAIWFTSDTHFGHKKLALYRRFATVEEHDKQLIKDINESVKPNDDLYHLGDFSFLGTEKTLSILAQLHGRINLVPGNHDHGMSGRVEKAFHDVLPHLYNLKVQHNGQPVRITLCHFPLLVWDRAHYGAWHLHGHSHGNLRHKGGKRMDVGIDAWDGHPVSLERLAKEMETLEYVQADQHQWGKESPT